MPPGLDFIPGFPADLFDWQRIFRTVDRRGRWVRHTGPAPEHERVPGAYPVYPSMKDVGFAMATWANPDGTRIFAGWRRLAVATSLHRATVIAARGALWRAGWIQLVHPAGQMYQPRTFSNEYRLTIPEVYRRYLTELIFPEQADPPAAGDLPLPVIEPVRGAATARPAGRHARIR